MIDRPILFNAPMVRATITGAKTQTRRVMKIQPPDDCGRILIGNYHPTIIDRHGEEQPGAETFGAYSDDGSWSLVSPYGKPSDLLWGKEAWRSTSSLDHLKPSQIVPRPGIQYEAGGTSVGADRLEAAGRYRSSRFMPRWASRITLEITGIRAERLQDISYEDALAEGMPDGARWIAEDATRINGETSEETARRLRWPQRWYENLWNEINGPGSWEINPWVWVIEFRRVEPH